MAKQFKHEQIEPLPVINEATSAFITGHNKKMISIILYFYRYLMILMILVVLPVYSQLHNTSDTTTTNLSPVQYLPPIICNGQFVYDLSQLDGGYGPLDLAACAIDGQKCINIDFSFITSLNTNTNCYCNSEVVRCLARLNCTLSSCAQSYCQANCPSIQCNSAHTAKFITNILLFVITAVLLL